MILTSLHRILHEPAAIVDNGGVVNVDAPAPKAEAAPAPVKEKQKTQPERKPSADELKVDFKIEPGDPAFVDTFPVEQLPEKKKEVATPPAKEDRATEAKIDDAVEQQSTEERAPVIDLNKPVVPIGKQAQGTARDYSGFSVEEVKVLKSMSNDAFTYTSKLMKENKELAQLKDASYLQHPSAFVLDPQFQKAQEDVQFFEAEAQHWQDQLALMAEGKPWKPIIGWQGNQPVYGPERAATAIEQERVRMAMQQCFNSVQQGKAQMQQFAATYNQRIQAGDTAIKQELANRCGWVADPKLLEEKIMTGVGEQSIKTVIDGFKNLLPAYHRNHIMTEVAANLWAALQIYGHQIRLLQNGKQVQDIRKEEVKRAEPTSEIRPTSSNGKVIGGVKEFSIEGMNL